METIKTRCIELCGTNYEVGYKIGKFIKDTYKSIECQLNETNVFNEEEEKYIIELFDKYCPGLNNELQGFADAINVNRNQVLYYAMTYLRPGCSQIALMPSITENGHVLLARNYEYSHQMEDFILCKTKICGKYAHIGTAIMQFGRSEGMNECGLAVSQTSCGFPVGSLEGMRKPAIIGLQFWAVIRSLLENCKNVDEALEVIKDMPIAYNINLLIADKSGNAVLVETLDGRKAIRKIEDRKNENKNELFLHSTNHIHIDELHRFEPLSMSNSIERYTFIEKYINKLNIISEMDLRVLLSSKYPNGLCCNYYNEFFGTIKSIIMDLNIGKIDICWGGLEDNGWNSYYLNETFEDVEQLININLETAPSGFFDFIE